jgi:hypothetical protein
MTTVRKREKTPIGTPSRSIGTPSIERYLPIIRNQLGNPVCELSSAQQRFDRQARAGNRRTICGPERF